MIGVVIPCYRVTAHIMDVLAHIPDVVERIYCIDDGCPEKTGDMIEAQNTDHRVRVLRHTENQGVGGAVVTGYRHALADGVDIVVKIDGDGQMNPKLLPQFIAPITQGRADYVKGNRFFVLSDLERMPTTRILGNAALSFLSKFSTGYWRVFDPTNGYTAISASVLRLLPLDKLHRRYFFESDMLFRLATLKAVVLDIPQRALYANEQSGISLLRSIPLFAVKHIRNFFARLFYNYFLRDFNLASLEWILGPLLLMFGLIFGIYNWVEARDLGVEASAGTVMLSALPFLAGLQLTLSAIGYDVDSQPRTPLHPNLKADQDK
ncbi:MAG: glycosyltransferase family 2 protein [Proteobacteria bacterium]|nr:glycosyltransferase family 2 protein [Pseudomonadota bacterium]